MKTVLHVGSALVLVLAPLALGSCGEEEGRHTAAEERIEALAERFEAILAAGDAKAFCAVLAPNDRLHLAEPGSKGRKECLAVWGADRNPLFAAKEPDVEIASLSFKGAYATAELTNGGTLAFAREGGRWYVHLAPSPGQTRGVGP